MSEVTQAAGARIRPFSNGSQAGDWGESNCARCTKNHDGERYRCDIQEAIDFAYIDDGSVSPEMAVRMGINHGTRDRYGWPCGEIEWTEEAKAEWAWRHSFRGRAALWIASARRRVRKWREDITYKLRMRLLWPIAVKRDAAEPDGCWAAWASWAMGYGERPGPGSGKGCSAVKPGESCWCGKFQGEPVD